MTGRVTEPEVTIVVTTRDRPALLAEAVESALAQSVADTRVLVVDDGSDSPVDLPGDPRLSVIRHPAPRGVAAARNAGASAATTPCIAYLDDDDRLRARFVEVSLETIAASDLPTPVGALSGVAVTDEAGAETAHRIPPAARPRGAHFSLEPLEGGRSYFTKQTLVVARDVLAGIGGFDEAFRSRVTTELFWRLNPVCSLAGSEAVTYELRTHPGHRISGDAALRQASFRQLCERHSTLLRSHPEGYMDLLGQHARTSLAAGQPGAAAAAMVRHLRVSPARTVAKALGTVSR